MPSFTLLRRCAGRAIACTALTLGAGAFAQAQAQAAAPAPATAPAPAPRAVLPLADGVWWLPGSFERGRQPDGNSLLLQGADGLVIVDSGRHAEHATALAAWVGERRAPLRVVVNTHWHLDHLGGNAALRRLAPGLRAWGSTALRDAVVQRMPTFEADLQRLRAETQTDAETRAMVDIDLALYAERAAFVPDETFDGAARERTPGGRRLTVGVERGVSGGDLWLLDHASGVLAVGDFVTLPVPFLDTACVSEWQAAMARLDALPFERMLPGHGPPLSRDDLRRYRRALDGLFACAASERTVADCSAGWIADLGPLLPGASQRSVAPMLGHYFDNLLRAPASQRARFCRG